MNKDSGLVTIAGTGVVVIEATRAEGDDYLGATAMYTLTVNKADDTLTFVDGGVVEKTFGDDPFTHTCNNDEWNRNHYLRIRPK